MSESDPLDTDPLETQPAITKPELQSRYQFRRKLGGGGLGIVSIYFDTELQREVALKEIRSDYADNSRLRREFCTEAAITGSLEHPGVVPIYSLGDSSDGRPYYAMRLIGGNNLRSAIKSFHKDVSSGSTPYLGPRLRELIRRLIEICNVMHYAHIRGVLHLDLKSDNVMVGRYGETLVIDWGLAKTTGACEVRASSIGATPSVQGEQPVLVTGSSLEQLPQGTAFGTIAYAPPEQLNGRADQIDSRSDLFSLGAILYEILTGDPPCAGMNRVEALHSVEANLIPPATEKANQAPKGLGAIAAKAISFKPQDRFQSAQTMREDLQSWLDDEPIGAYQESLLERTGRWRRKHQTFVRIATAALTLVTITSLFAVYRINVAKQNQEAARKEAMQLYKLARSATDNLLTGTSDRLSEIPDSTDVRRQLLKDAVKSYQEMAQFPAREPELRRDSVRVALKLATVQRELGEIDDAIESLDNGARILASSDFVEEQTLLVKVAVYASRLKSDQGDTAGAKLSLSKAMPLVERVMTESSSSAVSLLMKGEMMIQKGNVSFDDSDLLAAVESFESANLALRRALEKSQDSDLVRQIRFQLTRACNNEAYARLERMLQKEAPETAELKRISQRYDEALEQASWLVSDDPDDSSSAKEYALTLANYAEHLQLDRDDPEAAKALYSQSLNFFAPMVEKNPAVPRLKERQVMALTGLGNLAFDQNQSGQAIEHYEEAVELAEQMLLQNSVKLSFCRAGAQAYLELGKALIEVDPVRAKKSLLRSIDILPESTETIEWADDIRGNAEESLVSLESTTIQKD